jgi:error-prone DNA polymerase
MSHFDKDDVEELGLLKLDVLGIRMQSAMAHAIDEVERVDGVRPDIDAAPRDDPETFALIQSTRTLGMFQIESPGQRELVGKFAPETFSDIITDISLFRPGPVKSDMVTPFLEARQGWKPPGYIHDDFIPFLEQTSGVVVFHEQVLELIATCTGCTLAEADEARRALGSDDGQLEVKTWFLPAALRKGYSAAVVQKVWEVLVAFASFGFCKAHAAAFAVPTFQSAWLKTHHTAAFLAGVLTHDPGMYPKRLILDDARQFGIAVLALDINASDDTYRIERMAEYDEPPPAILSAPPEPDAEPLHRVQGSGGETGLSNSPNPALGERRQRRYGIRLSLADVKGISAAEVARIIAGRPYHSLSDFWHRAAPSRPVAERLVLAGALDSLYGIGATAPVKRRGQLTRRDLLLQLTELDAWTRGVARTARKVKPRASDLSDRGVAGATRGSDKSVRELAAAQSQAPAAVESQPAVQLALDLGDDPAEVQLTGLPEMTAAERVRAELDILGIDASEHVLSAYSSFLQTIGVTRSRDLLRCRSRAQLLVAGVKVATQTPPIRSGKRVVFVTLDDATGPVDATFFEDAQVGYASTLFHSWLLVIRGVLRRTGPRGVSLRATGAWELPVLFDAWRHGGLEAVEELLSQRPDAGFDEESVTEAAVQGAAESRSTRPVMTKPPVDGVGGKPLVYASGFALSPYADIRPAGTPVGGARGSRGGAPRKLWHSSPGSSGG